MFIESLGEKHLDPEADTAVETDEAPELTPEEQLSQEYAVQDPSKPVQDDTEESEETPDDTEEVESEESGEEVEDDGSQPAFTDESAPEVSEDAGPKYDAAILQRAAQLGWDWTNVARFPNDAALAAAVSAAEFERMRPQPEQQQATVADTPPEFKPYEMDRESLELADESVVGQLDAMNQHNASQFQQLQQHYGQQISQLQQQVNDMMGHTQSQQQLLTQQQDLEKIKEFDTWANGKGEEYKSLLGEGDSNRMDRMTPEYGFRKNVFQAADKLAEIFPGESRAEILDRALASVSNGHSKTIARKELQNETAKRTKQRQARPTQRKSSGGESGLDRAAQTWEAGFNALQSGQPLQESGSFGF